MKRREADAASSRRKSARRPPLSGLVLAKDAEAGVFALGPAVRRETPSQTKAATTSSITTGPDGDRDDHQGAKRDDEAERPAAAALAAARAG